ncbi:DNA internalization-related competence protein ComEC/Rec2 [Leeia sp.]|uniref:DNA internalization-related competence protein ComEC/Rec2 n=1 Tax=Leeia sp. TaxID=2884678 RepID=UPI0035B013D1
MRVGVLAWLIGVVCLQQRAALPSLSLLLCLLALALPGLCLWRRYPVCGYLGCLLAGFAISGLWALPRSAAQSAWPATAQHYPVCGTVLDLPELHQQTLWFTLQPDARLPLPDHAPLRIGWYLGGSTLQPATPHAAEYWCFDARLRPVHGQYNPGGSDLAAHYWANGLYRSGYLDPKTAQRRTSASTPPLRAQLNAWREALRQRLLDQLGDHPQRGLIVALSLGDQSLIPADQWMVYRQTGVTHLVSISGLHITLFAWLASLLGGAVWRRMPAAAARLPAQQVGLWLGLMAATVYTALSGLAIPAERTWLMLLVACWMLSRGRRYHVSDTLAVALWVILITDPWAVLSSGFWLSFGAVALLVWHGSGRQPGRWYGALRSQWAMFAGMLPLLVYGFGLLSLIAPVANAVAIPWVSLLLAPISIASLLLPGLGEGTAMLAQGLFHVLAVLAQWPLATLSLAAPGVLTTLLAGAGGLLLLAPRGWPGRGMGFLVLLPLFWSDQLRPAAGAIHLSVLDVGQGLAVHLQTATHDLLYDTGARGNGERVLLPYFRSQAVSRLDLLMLSHDDNDHTGASRELLQGLPTMGLLASMASPPDVAGARPFRRCQAGQHWQWDGVDFAILWPPAHSSPEWTDNQRSCVLRVTGAFGSVLLTGDLEQNGETALIASGVPLHSTVLVASHHGSKRSSSTDWIQAVAPAAVIFSAGYGNAFHHPHPDTLARFHQQSVPSWRTDLQGAIQLKLDGQDLQPQGWLDSHRRYWHAVDH